LEMSNKWLLASVLRGVGYGLRKCKKENKLNINLSIAAFTKALEVWPDSNILQNNLAITLSKSANIDDLDAAESILRPVYLENIKDKKPYFVTPYYLADIYIKLAKLVVDEQEQKALYISVASDALDRAEETLQLNKGYTHDYTIKSLAKVYRLRMALSGLEALIEKSEVARSGKSARAEKYKKLALEKINSIDYDPVKKAKFIEKVKLTRKLVLFYSHNPKEKRLSKLNLIEKKIISEENSSTKKRSGSLI